MEEVRCFIYLFITFYYCLVIKIESFIKEKNNILLRKFEAQMNIKPEYQGSEAVVIVKIDGNYGTAYGLSADALLRQVKEVPEGGRVIFLRGGISQDRVSGPLNQVLGDLRKGVQVELSGLFVETENGRKS